MKRLALWWACFWHEFRFHATSSVDDSGHRKRAHGFVGGSGGQSPGMIEFCGDSR